MDISINTNSTIPIYEQIVIQVQTGIKEKRILPNDSLPPIRQLAIDLNLTANTVAKAYQILEQNNIISTAGRRGTFIHPDAKFNTNEFIHQKTIKEFREFILSKMNYGLSTKNIKEIFNQVIVKI